MGFLKMQKRGGVQSRGQKKPFTALNVQMLETLLSSDIADTSVRDCALLRVAIDTALRSSDILALTVDDVTHDGVVKDELILQQTKTKRTVRCAIMPRTKIALGRWIATSGYAGCNRLFPFTSQRYRQIIKGWARMLRLDPRAYSTHSMRRSKVALIYQETKDIAVARQILGHASLAETCRYLDVDGGKAMDVARSFDI